MRASAYREGEYARRMMAVEDRTQVMSDYTFALLLRKLNTLAQHLTEVWTAYDGSAGTASAYRAR